MLFSGATIIGARRKYSLLLTTLLVSTLLSGCEQLIDLAIDCIDNDKPELSGLLPHPILNHEYNEVVHVGIRNEPYDDQFDYQFTVSGNFPSGLQSESSGRDLRLFGTPIELGDFSFTIKVEVGGGGRIGIADGTEGLCSTIDTKAYQWTVQPM